MMKRLMTAILPAITRQFLATKPAHIGSNKSSELGRVES